MKEIKLQKFLQNCGLASRRDIRQWIHEGKFKINRLTVTDPNFTIKIPGDQIHLGKKLLKLNIQNKSYFIFNKPVGIVSTLNDPQGRSTISSFITRIKERVYPVGRLDYNSDGLMLLTNDGDLANFIISAKNQVPKTYLLKVQGDISAATQKKLEKGVF
ncbi:MAG: pseudouridine synthase, partial [Chrysiogenales bacterium]